MRACARPTSARTRPSPSISRRTSSASARAASDSRHWPSCWLSPSSSWRCSSRGRHSTAARAPARSPRRPRPRLQPSPTVDPALAAALDRRQCQSDTGWRLVTRERDGDIDSRTLWEVPQLAPTASLALDRPFRLWAQAVMAMGFCAPGNRRAARGGMDDVTLSRVLDDGQIASVVNPATPTPNWPRWARSTWPRRKAMSPAGIWPAGDYLFRVQPQESDPGGWFALQVIQPEPAPAPG